MASPVLFCAATSWIMDDWRYWLAMLLAIAAAASPLGRFLFHHAGRLLDRLAANRPIAIATVAAVSLGISIPFSILLGIPAPRLHDEFSQLLAADTFAHGRVTNPPHPLSAHFETIHVLQHPTYASKFPPAHALMMAIGIVTADLPIAGQWLAIAAACAAICWMLYAVLPPRWALFGGLLAIIHPQVLTWTQSYLGSGVPLAGGALVLGAFLRIINRPRLLDGLLLALGLSILANSRPYEGLLVSVPLAFAFLVWLIRTKPQTRRLAITRVILPCIAVMSLTFTAMAYYNWRITGSPLLSPYVLHERTYNRTPHFFFQALKPPIAYHENERAELHGQWEPAQWYRQRTFLGFAGAATDRVLAFITAWLHPLLLGLALVALPSLLKSNPLLRLICLLILIFVAGLLPLTWMLKPHYFTPAGGLVFLLLVACMQRLHETPSPLARATVRAIVAACIVATRFQAAYLYDDEIAGWQHWRINISQMLTAEYSDHLVIVRYLPGHDVHQEWVYNAADIDHARIVFAREMGREKDRELIDYYKTRRVWLLELGQIVRIIPYSQAP